MTNRRMALSGRLILGGLIFFVGTAARAQSRVEGVYKSNCAECHGTDGAADTAMGRSLGMRDLRSPEVQKRTDADLTDIITNGMATMPSFKDKLMKRQIDEIVAYLRRMAKREG